MKSLLVGVPTGGIDCLVAGACSEGEEGKPYIITKRTKLGELLGVGTLVERIQDIFQGDVGELGHDITLLAVPVPSEVTPITASILKKSGTGPDIRISGTQEQSMQLVVKIELDVLKLDGTVQFDQGIKLMENKFTYSLDGGDTFENSELIAIPENGIFRIPETGMSPNFPEKGMSLHFPDSDTLIDGEVYTNDFGALMVNVADTIPVIDPLVRKYNINKVYITGPTNLEKDWIRLGTYADRLFKDHHAVSIITEVRNLIESETYQEWANLLMEERTKFDHPHIDVVAAIGEAVDKDNRIKEKNLAGLLVGRLLSSPTNRHIGRVKSGAVRGVVRVEPGYAGVKGVLEKAGFITITRFVGLNGFFWGDDRTLGDDTSIFKSIRPRETVFKALRIARSVALQFIRDEANTQGTQSGMNALKAAIENAIFNNMIGASSHRELQQISITIPQNQDPEKGINVEMGLMGIPVIQKIKLYASYSTEKSGLSI